MTAAAGVFESLRAQIISVSLVPGTVLSRADLAARFGVSRTPVRDALMRLAEEGLVAVFPQHATLVSPIDMALARQAHFLRRAVELEIVETLAGDPPGDLIAALRELLERQRVYMTAGDTGAFIATDEAFHARMYVAAEVPDLLSLVRGRSGHLDRLRRLHLMTPGKAQRILDEHGRIVDALADGDTDRARMALRTHLTGTLAEAPHICGRFPTYFKD